MPILFDIETKPRPDLVEKFTKPFPAFDPSAVKMGNIKQPELRLAKMQEAEASHKADEAAYWTNARDRAALNPLTAEALCIGLLPQGGSITILGANGESERQLLTAFWDAFTNPHHIQEPFVFWSGNGGSGDNFDPDFIIKRSWILGVTVPPGAFGERGYLGRRMVDAAQRYLMGKREAYCSLSNAAEQLGLFDEPGITITRKDKDRDLVTGENFHLWWTGKAPLPHADSQQYTAEHQKDLARSYLVNDVEILDGIVRRIF